MQLTEVKIEDINRIAKLAHKIWNEHYPPIIGQIQVDYMLLKFYSNHSLLEQMENGQIFYLLNESGRDIGFAAVSRLDNNNWFLNKLYVDSTYQKQSFGHEMLIFLTTRHNMKTLKLQVNRMNYKAINFYFKNGFVIEGLLDFDIGDGFQMNDFVMTLKSSNKI
jgi:RimJ/RimL family protein N-acetyltransferase